MTDVEDWTVEDFAKRAKASAAKALLAGRIIEHMEAQGVEHFGDLDFDLIGEPVDA